LYAKPIPSSPVFSRDEDAFVDAVMKMIEYDKKYSERNHQFGELILPCDNHGWDVFMEMIEVWDTTGGEIELTANEIQFLDSDQPGKIVLASLFPPIDSEVQRVWVHTAGILSKYGLEAVPSLVQKIDRDLIQNQFILVNENFSIGDAALLVEFLSRWWL
jgi:hypothetical protein